MQSRKIRKMLTAALKSRLKKHGKYAYGALMGRMGFCRPMAIDIQHGQRKQWVNLVNVDLRIESLGSAFNQTKLVHISDLHCSNTVSAKYLQRCVNRINQLDADIVVMTGDYVTHDVYGRYRKKVVDLMSQIKSRHGVYACLGNHDYGMAGAFEPLWQDLLSEMLSSMDHAGIHVLRNQAKYIQIADQRLWIVGLGDLWAGDFDPRRAFAYVTPSEPVIALSHNPKTVEILRKYPANVILSGHTHGVQRQVDASGSLPVMRKHRHHAGLYNLDGTHLYVNRGLGRLGKAFFNARPEITVFNLH